MAQSVHPNQKSLLLGNCMTELIRLVPGIFPVMQCNACLTRQTDRQIER